MKRGRIRRGDPYQLEANQSSSICLVSPLTKEDVCGKYRQHRLKGRNFKGNIYTVLRGGDRGGENEERDVVTGEKG